MSTRFDRRIFLRHVIGATGAGLGVSLFAACAPSSAPAPTSAPAAAAGPASPKSVTKVSYAYASPNGFHFIATIGSVKPDLPHKFGIEFDLLTTTNSPNAVNALVGGSVDVAACTPDSAWPAQDKAPDVKQLITIADGTPYVLLAQPEIKKAADLKGKVLGASAIRGGADTTALRIILAENGVAETDYTVIQAGAISDRTAAMKAKSIDALAQLEPQATLLRNEGFPEVDSANNYPALKGVHSIVLIAKKTWYEGNAENAANFLRAWDSITKWIYDPTNKDEVMAISTKAFGGSEKSSEAVYNLHVTGKSVSPNLRITEKFMQQFVANLKKVGTENLPADGMKYVDSSLVTKALNA
jgi:NitT/TauT family transport system substrate-binding protein